MTSLSASSVSSRVPVILIPGISGSKLWDSREERFIWGTGAQLVSPKDGGYEMALPLFEGFTGTPRIVAVDTIDEMRLGPVRKKIYGPMTRLFVDRGYRRGELRHPHASDDLFLFAYDWRHDNVLAAQALMERLLELKAVRSKSGSERLPVRLICQSNGAHICRYLIKYGGASLEQAEAVTDGRYSLAAHGIDVERVVLIGSSNGGAIRILRELDRGRSYVPIAGRKLRPEMMFTLVALYQDLPVYQDRVFLNQHGRELDLDLFDADVWVRYGFSIFGEEARARVRRSGRSDLFGTTAERRDFLAAALERSQRFHRVLMRDPVDLSSIDFFQIQNLSTETAHRAVLTPVGVDQWRLLFTGDRELRRSSHVYSLATAMGDGHATIESQSYLSPREIDSLADPVRAVGGEHLDMIVEDDTLQAIEEYLVEKPN